MHDFLKGAAIGALIAATAIAIPMLWGSTTRTPINAPCASQGAQ